MSEDTEIPDQCLATEIIFEEEAYSLFVSWGLSENCINMLGRCGVTNCTLLKMMHSCDINTIFNERHQISERITFRYNLQKWRIANSVSKCAFTREQILIYVYYSSISCVAAETIKPSPILQ